jgi:hypothetical protein
MKDGQVDANEATKKTPAIAASPMAKLTIWNDSSDKHSPLVMQSTLSLDLGQP